MNENKLTDLLLDLLPLKASLVDVVHTSSTAEGETPGLGQVLDLDGPALPIARGYAQGIIASKAVGWLRAFLVAKFPRRRADIEVVLGTDPPPPSPPTAPPAPAAGPAPIPAGGALLGLFAWWLISWVGAAWVAAGVIGAVAAAALLWPPGTFGQLRDALADRLLHAGIDDLVPVTLKAAGIEGWTVDRRGPERRLAWRLYIELQSRVATQPLGNGDGLLREAFGSLYGLYGVTRDALLQAPPPADGRGGSVQDVALAVLNQELRVFLARWHPRFEEAERGAAAAGLSQRAIEAAWADADACRAELSKLQEALREYGRALHLIARGRSAEALAPRP